MKVPQGSPVHSELAPHVILIYKENRTVKSGWLVLISFNSCLLSLVSCLFIWKWRPISAKRLAKFRNIKCHWNESIHVGRNETHCIQTFNNISSLTFIIWWWKWNPWTCLVRVSLGAEALTQYMLHNAMLINWNQSCWTLIWIFLFIYFIHDL